MNAQREKLRMMLTSAIFAAIIGILAQVTIPLPLVPITGQTLAVGLAALWQQYRLRQLQRMLDILPIPMQC